MEKYRLVQDQKVDEGSFPQAAAAAAAVTTTAATTSTQTVSPHQQPSLPLPCNMNVATTTTGSSFSKKSSSVTQSRSHPSDSTTTSSGSTSNSCNEFPEVRITQQGKPRNYISYAMGLLVSTHASVNRAYSSTPIESPYRILHALFELRIHALTP
jgi:hypothetical protein